MPFTRFTLRQIEAFVAVSELYSFRMAADQLGLTAQAVSQLVSEMEGSLGFRVFDRTTRNVTLSSAGKDFLPSVLTLLRHVSAAEGAAADVRNKASGLVRVGAPMVLAATALPEAIRTYHQLRPQVIVRIRDVPVEAIADCVIEGDVDLAVGPDRTAGNNVERVSLFESPWVLWCARTHPFAKKKTLKWSDLQGHALVAAGRDHERSVAQMHIGAPADQRVIPVDVVDNISTAMGIASQGLAATLAPAYIGVMARNMGLVARRVLEPETVRNVCLYKPVAKSLSPAALGFAEFLQDWLVQWQTKARREKT
jgi:DNA-binding transcriptional LysR family regulator